MKLKPANKHSMVCIINAIGHLSLARDYAVESDSPKLLIKIRSALKSADGARRHMERRMDNAK